MTQMKPHLCTDVDLTKLVTPCWGLEKIDGVRMLHITGSATGRSLKPHGNLFTTAKFSDPKYSWLDGEITFGDIRSDSLCRDTTSVMSRIHGEPEVVWNVFDYLAPEVVDKPYNERYAALVEYVAKHLADDKSTRVVPYKVLNSVQEVEEHYNKLLEEGFEGLIVRAPDGLTKFGRATVKEGAYLRMKASSDKEAVCLQLVEAEQNLNEAKIGLLGRTERSSHKENKVGKGMVGMLVCKDLETGMEIDVGAGKLTHEERTYYWNNPQEIVGKFIKYRSMDSGVKEKPRFARMISIRTESDMS
jgi:hypothetical protein